MGGPSRDPDRIDALAFLNEWASNPQAQPYFALLGDLGMGKTTTCMAFARDLLARRAADPAAPLPIYLDLRYLGDQAKQEPMLKTILDTVLARSWRGGQAEPSVGADEAIRLVQQEGAIAIFDGLDEVLVHLSKAAGQRFVREIFRILPPAGARHGAASPKAPAGKSKAGVAGRLLVACRTHYFRTLREQQNFLTAEDRDDIRPEDYRALILLPFTDEQIRDYFRHSLPDEDPDRILDLIRAVHNLSEMAERPYTLSLIARHIPQIERWKLQGRKVTGVMLYRHMVMSWLERDDGKHQILPEHKRRIMEHLAAELWRSGRRLWSVGELEQWLIDFLASAPEVAAHYGAKDRELLKEDLRTATFLVREGEDSFRFAHTSLQEFFLACYLLDALRRGTPERWQIPLPSIETLDFLGQLLLEENQTGSESCFASLRAIRDAYLPQASELAFRFWLHALRKTYPVPSSAGFRLEGADLRGMDICGAPSDARINLRGASFRQARLAGATLSHLDLEGARFDGADLGRCDCVSIRAPEVVFSAALLAGAVFRQCNFAQGDFTNVAFQRTQFLHCDLRAAVGLGRRIPDVFFACCNGVEGAPQPARDSARLEMLDGHSGFVLSCAWSPDGRRLASASWDQTLRLWDAASGECLSVLRGHEAGVSACAWSPDGRRLASASWDRTLRLWNAASGECLRVLRGHDRGVSSCAWSPDSRQLASASADRTLRVWDAVRGECLRVLRGHERDVTTCAWSPESRQLASGSGDQTVRLWDAASGECLNVLRGHKSGVTTCAWSPDGRQLASASEDRTVRQWDAISGECLSVLRGHERGVTACAWSPDARKLASGARDDTVRLWDASSGDCIRVLNGHEGRVTACAFSPEGWQLASASWDQTVRLWDVVSDECLSVLRGHERGVTACAWSPDSRQLASAAWDDALHLWDAASGECLNVLRGHVAQVTACAWSPDGLQLASAAADHTLRLWAAASGECIRVLRGHGAEVATCAWLLDGRQLASASADQTVRVWDAVSGKCLSVLRGHEERVTACAWSPGGRQLASASWDKTVRLWDAASGECLSVLRSHEDSVTACAWSPDGRQLASASWDETVRLWDATSGECLSVLRSHDADVTACAWSPDGRLLASASEDQTVCLWDAAGGECLSVLRGHERGVTGCAWSPDGRQLATCAWDGSICFWDTATFQPAGLRIHQFRPAGWAAIDSQQNRVIRFGGEAWRWLRWRSLGANGQSEIWPAEVFGPLPTSVLT